MTRILPLFFFLLCFSNLAVAQSNIPPTAEGAFERKIDHLQQIVEKLSQTIEAQQKQIDQLQATKEIKSPNTTDSAPATSTAPPVYVGSNPKSAGNYVPDIGVVADIVGNSTESKLDEEGNDRLSVREVELVLGHDIDPYARMDVVATLSDLEDPDIEEANITYWDLPFGLKAKVGRMRQRIGKASATHRDALDSVDEPFVVSRYFGAEGLFRTGLELSAFNPLSTDNFTQELVLGGMEGGSGEEGELFGETRRHPTIYGHAANFLQISDMNSLELGGTYLLGSKNDESTLDHSVFGVDLTAVHFFTPINKLKLQSEAYLQHRDENTPMLDESTDGLSDTEEQALSKSNPYGFYTLADFRISERWGLGARYDYVQPTETSESGRNYERGYSTFLTFYQSEFARWRMQYERALLEDSKEDDRFFLQGTFAIGTHKHNLN